MIRKEITYGAILLSVLFSACNKKPAPIYVPPPEPIAPSVVEARPPAELEAENARLKAELDSRLVQLNETKQDLLNLRVMYAEVQNSQHPVGTAIGKWFKTHEVDHKDMRNWMSRMESALEKRARDESAREAKRALDNMKKVIDILGD